MKITLSISSADGVFPVGKDDVLHGAENAILAGGEGNDVYNLWSASASVVEFAGHGIDTVIARYWGAAILPDHVENLVLMSEGSTRGTGNALDNTITASAFGSTLNGGAGSDTLIGAGGADIFEFAAFSGSDMIVNFQPGWDSIRLENMPITSFDDLMAQAIQVGADASFELSGGTLTLQGVKLSDLQAADFGFDQAAMTALEGFTLMEGAGRAYNAQGWYVHNNAWGAGRFVEGTDFTLQSVYSRQDMTGGTTFTWSFPYQTDSFSPILAFPEVSFGVAPKAGEGHKRNPTDNAAVFPVQVADIASLIAEYDVEIGGTVSGFNVAYDIWLTSEPYGGRETITNEIMVWVHSGDFPAYGTQIGRYEQHGFAGTIYNEGTYTAIVADHDVLAGSLDIGALLNTLNALGIVSDAEYLASIHLGAEVVSGNGSLAINSLEFTLDVHEEDGSILRKHVNGAGTSVSELMPAEAELPDDLLIADALEGYSTVTQEGGATETRYYGPDDTFLGAERLIAKGRGEIMTLKFDASWAFVKAQNSFDYGDGRSSIRYFDAQWQLAGAQNSTVKSDGSVSTQFFDENWVLVGAEISNPHPNGTMLTTHYDAGWQVLSRSYDDAYIPAFNPALMDNGWLASGSYLIV